MDAPCHQSGPRDATLAIRRKGQSNSGNFARNARECSTTWQHLECLHTSPRSLFFLSLTSFVCHLALSLSLPLQSRGESKHTIILLQQTSSPHSRTYYDFESKSKAMEAVVRFFEEALKASNPHKPTLSYDVSDIHAFIDRLGDISCMVLDPASGKYEPHGKDYIKESVFKMLKQQAMGR